MTQPAVQPAEIRFVVYRDSNKEFRWRLYRGSRIIGDSAESYKRASSALLQVKNIRSFARNSTVVMQNGNLKTEVLLP